MVSLKNRWSPTLFRLHRLLKKEGVQNCRLLVGVSGGLDSVYLLSSLIELRKSLGLDLIVAYIHHGGRSEYRAQAQKFVAGLAQKNDLPFYSKKSKTRLKSEDEMREFRRAALIEIQALSQASFIALGHHADDLLETRLIRLIRGTGFRGLEAMAFQSDGWLRPLLFESRIEIEKEARLKKLHFLEDPSNGDGKYLRNWIRNDWLPLLEDYRPGALKALARSLELLLESDESSKKPALDTLLLPNRADGGVQRAKFALLSQPQRRIVVSDYLRKLGKSQFSYSQIEEILKHLDKIKKDHTFVVAGLFWTVTSDRIFAKLKEPKNRQKNDR